MAKRRPSRSYRLRGLVFLGLLILWPVFSFAEEKPGDEAGRLRLGVVVPTSGPFAPVGRQVVESARLAAVDLELELVIHDSEGLPEKAIEAVASLAKDPRVVAIVGPVGRHESQAAAGMAGRLGVPLFTLSSMENVNQVGPTVFRVRQSPAEQARGLARAAREVYGLERAAIFFPSTDYGRGAAIAFAQTFIARGGRVVAATDYPADTTNFSH
ncbi:MAG: ABC transporter substrate-binding protein, partial [Bradymonadaceae bacterium]